MTIAVLCYDCSEVDIIRDAPNMTSNDEIEEWLIDKCNYNADEISWMVAERIKINDLTPEDFG